MTLEEEMAPAPPSPPGSRRLCPHCGSADLHYHMGGVTGWQYQCKGCHYIGAYVVEGDEETARALREQWQKRGKGRVPTAAEPRGGPPPSSG